jgi:hypothetical protein
VGRVSKKKSKVFLAVAVEACIICLPRLEPSAHRFFNRSIKQCVWALAAGVGENQISDVSAHKDSNEFLSQVHLSNVLAVPVKGNGN